MHTTYLSPVTATHIAWALTGGFTKGNSKIKAELAEAQLNEIRQLAISERKTNEEEFEYVNGVYAAINAVRRSLEVAYKGRELNFKENEELRDSYLESVKDSVKFGSSARDFLKSLPAMVIGGAGGVTIAEYLNISGIELWAIGLGLAAIGYIINLKYVTHARKITQMHYIQQDYEHDLYFDQYITRVQAILLSLYTDVNRIHFSVFGEYYDSPLDSDKDSIFEHLLEGLKSPRCKYLIEHMRKGIVTPELWPLCETGSVQGKDECKYWENDS